jgi:hypothetical protein
MRATAVILGVLSLVPIVRGQGVLEEAQQLERHGAGARAALVLRQAAAHANASPSELQAYAEFLDRHANPGARAAYERLLAALTEADGAGTRLAVTRRLVLLSLEAGDRAAAAGYLSRYRQAGGKEWAQASLERPVAPPEPQQTIEIPGPLNSFRRMAAVSQDVKEDELILAVARSVITNGYRAGGRKEGLEPTEYLKLLTRYLSQARELDKLAGPEKQIRVENCDSPQAADLLRTLGYRMRGGCGGEVVLETVNASRGFLTIDSGFPLAELEQSLRTNRPFTYEYRPTRAPILYNDAYWLTSRDQQGGEFIDALISDPSLCRFYLAMAKPDPATAEELRKNIPAARLRAFAHVVDFFGSMFEIRDGRAVVPGGARSARMWEELAGAPPSQGAQFFEHLISRDDGWLASYFDALTWLDGPVRDYLTEPERMKRFYSAIRGRITSPGPARPVFQANTDMLLLMARLRLEPGGKAHVPGGIEPWKGRFVDRQVGKYGIRLSRPVTAWKDPDDVLEALFALCRKSVANEPLRIFLALSDIDRGRTRPLDAATVNRLALDYGKYGSQYPIFAEASALDEKTILRFLDTAAQIDRIGDPERRADAVGTFQSLVGIWQILCRQGAIAEKEADASLSDILTALAAVRNARDTFHAGRSGVELLLKAAPTRPGAAAQSRLMDLLAGVAGPEEAEAHEEVVASMAAYFDAQRLVSLDLLFGLADHLDALARGEKLDSALVARLASKIAEVESPRAELTAAEKNSLTLGYWTDHHLESERGLNFRSAIGKAGRDPEKLRDVRGSLAPLLRDTLVGLNYIHYAPPGAQLLRSSPAFVRSHDFIGTPGGIGSWNTTESLGSGWPNGAGGRLQGSLAGLPYALAQAEQNFLIPDREQAVIWGDLAPQIIQSATIPRWWKVSPSQLQWVALHLRYASALAAEAALDEGVRAQVLQALARQAVPARLHRLAVLLERGDIPAALAEITPSERFMLAQEMLAHRPGADDALAATMRRLAAEIPAQANYAAVSRAFGTPKPMLTGSYGPELLYLRPFPALMGYSSRLLAESWESNALYWAALADESHLPPARLNVAAPQWTREVVERIFASHLEDWPALLRSLLIVGEDIRQRAHQAPEGEQQASLN